LRALLVFDRVLDPRFVVALARERVVELFAFALDFAFVFEREVDVARVFVFVFDVVLVFVFDLAFDEALFVFRRAVDFDFELDLEADFAFALDFARDFDVDLDFDADVDLDFDFAFDVDFDLDFAFDLDFDLDLAFADDFVRAPLFLDVDALRRDPPREPEPAAAPSSSDSPSPSSSSEPISFFATPTAAGIATPSAVPATTFCVVERPSSSSFDMLTSRAPASRWRASPISPR